jgi:predicted nucleotidyltransferase
MLTRNDIENTLKRLKPELQERFHVRSIGYFGSFAKGSQTELSDLDLLVEFSQPIGWDFFALECFLGQSFGIPVDLVARDALKQFIKEPILREVHYV